MAIRSISGDVSVSTSAANLAFSEAFSSGYIYNAGATEAIIYMDETSDVVAKAQKIPAGASYDWNHNNRRENGHTGFRYKTASSTTTLYYHAEE